jgi:TRAP-type C4-dicarboxylate transport system substrate-binding protein
MALRTLAVCSLVLAVAAGGARAATIKAAAFIPPTGVSVSKVLVPFIKTVEQETGGDLKIKGFWGGSLGRSPFKQYKLISDGVTDIGFVPTVYASGQFPDNAIMELPYNIRSAAFGSIAMWRLYKRGLLRGYDNVKVISTYMTDYNAIHSRKPLASLADLKGMKIRSGGAISNEFLKSLGAVPVSMSATKVTEAVSRGVIDGLMQSWNGLVVFRTQNVVSYHYDAPLGTISLNILMNKDSWNKLSAKHKAVIDKHGGEVMARKAGEYYDKIGSGYFEKFIKEKKRTIIRPAKASYAAARKAVQPIYDGWISKTPDGQKKFDTLMQILTDLRAGK